MVNRQRQCGKTLPHPGLLAVVLVAGLALGGGWWWQQRQAIHFLGRYPAGQGVAAITVAGFTVVAEKDPFYPRRPFTLLTRNWRGQETGRFSVPGARLPFACAEHTPGWLSRPIAKSPDGRVIAVAVPEGQHTRVYTWRDGHMTGEVMVPLASEKPDLTWGSVGLRAVEHGNVYLWHRACRDTPLYVVSGSRLLATGRFRCGTGVFGKKYNYANEIAPDGQSLTCSIYNENGSIQRTEFASLTITGNRLAVKTHATLPVVNELLFNQGTLLSYYGQVYRTWGTSHLTAGWALNLYDDTGRYCLQEKGQALRVFSPVTGDQWTIPAHKGWDLQKAGITPDGCYAAVLETRRSSATRGTAWLAHTFPATKQAIDRVTRRKQHRLSIYERSGRLCARARLDSTAPEIDDSTFAWHGDLYDLQYLDISPGGHHLVMEVYAPDRKQSEYLLWRW